MLGFDASRGGNFSVNVSERERLASLLAGSFLLGFGLSRRGMVGKAVAALGVGAIYRGASGHCPMYQSMAKSTSGAATLTPAKDFFSRGTQVDVSQTINRPPQELYNYWRDFSNLPKFMNHLKSVDPDGSGRTKWTVNGPGGVTLSWSAEIINDEPGKKISWRSVSGGDVDTAGTVLFNASGAGTTVRVVLDYIPPAGKVGATVAKFFGRSAQDDVADDLKRFKKIMEAGELPTVDEPARASA